MASIKLDKGGLLADANREARIVVNRTTRRVYNRSQVLCPVDQGYLRSTGHPRYDMMSGRGPRGMVEYTANYAATIEKGGKARVIRAKRKKALAFEWHGRDVFFKRVKHPATKAQPFLRPAAEEIATSEGFRFIPRN